MTMTPQTQPFELPELPDQATLDTMLDKTKGRLFFMPGASWRGSLLCSHKLIWDHSCPTAWCDGSTIAFSPWFFLKLGQDERVTLLAHELDHTMYDHAGRLYGRDPELWNVAADYIINNDLDRMGYSFKDMHPLLDHQYDGMSTEQLYDLLLKEGHKPPPIMSLICPEDGQTGDKPSQDPGNGPTGPSGSGGTNSPDPSGSPIPSLCGDLRMPSQGAAGKAQHQETIASIVRAVQAAHQSKDAGSLPGEIQQIIEEFLDPVLPWDVLLKRYFTEMSNDDYSWRRPNRRHEDIYLPTLLGDNGLDHLIYYLDVSGSVTDEQVLRFFSEVRYIHNELKPKQLTLVTFDKKIQDEYNFFEGDPFEKIEINGRGGTDLGPVYHHIVKHRPTAAVIFSDLYVYPMYTDPVSPVLWVIMDNKKAVTHFGKRIHLSKDMIG